MQKNNSFLISENEISWTALIVASNTAKSSIFNLSTCDSYNHSGNWKNKTFVLPYLLKTTNWTNVTNASNKHDSYSLNNCNKLFMTTHCSDFDHATLWDTKLPWHRQRFTLFECFLSSTLNAMYLKSRNASTFFGQVISIQIKGSVWNCYRQKGGHWDFSASSEDNAIVIKKEDKSSKRRTYGNPKILSSRVLEWAHKTSCWMLFLYNLMYMPL